MARSNSVVTRRIRDMNGGSGTDIGVHLVWGLLICGGVVIVILAGFHWARGQAVDNRTSSPSQTAMRGRLVSRMAATGFPTGPGLPAPALRRRSSQRRPRRNTTSTANGPNRNEAFPSTPAAGSPPAADSPAAGSPMMMIGGVCLNADDDGRCAQIMRHFAGKTPQRQPETDMPRHRTSDLKGAVPWPAHMVPGMSGPARVGPVKFGPMRSGPGRVGPVDVRPPIGQGDGTVRRMEEAEAETICKRKA